MKGEGKKRKGKEGKGREGRGKERTGNEIAGKRGKGKKRKGENEQERKRTWERCCLRLPQGTSFNLRDDAMMETALGLLCVGNTLQDAFEQTRHVLQFMETHLGSRLPRAAMRPSSSSSPLEPLPADIRGLVATFRFLSGRMSPQPHMYNKKGFG